VATLPRAGLTLAKLALRGRAERTVLAPLAFESAWAAAATGGAGAVVFSCPDPFFGAKRAR
jgi:hypothetical protein